MNSRPLRAAVIFACLVSGPLPQASRAHPQSESLDATTGTLDVDYAGYLSKHDVVFNHPITDPHHGSTVGNGRVGAMVWDEDGLKLQITGIDASEETAFSAGLIHLHTIPAMDGSYARFQQRLSLYDGILTVKYDANRIVTVMGSPNSEVLGIHVSDTRPGVSEVTLDLSIWDVRRAGGGDVANIADWRNVTTYADAGGVGLSRGQKDSNHFGYTLAATVEGARFSTKSVDAHTVRLSIVPSASYTIWVACASRMNAPGHDSLEQAGALLDEVRAETYGRTLANYENWWHAFWQKSFVQYSDAARDGDYLENLYYLYTYIIAAGSYATYPFHFINGDFSAVGDGNSTKWSVAYWYYNQREIDGSFLASNHPEVLHGLNELYSRNLNALVAHTRERFRIDGIWVPETMGWDGNARHTEDSDWTKAIFSTGAEAAEDMYAEYGYTNDAAYLRTTAYPFMKGVAGFYTRELTRDPDTGRYFMARSNALETYWDVRDAITDLAAVRSLFPMAIQASVELGVDGGLRRQWRSVLDHLAAYPVVEDGSRYAPHDPPPAQNRNWQNITSELIWPFGVTGIAAPDYPLAINGWMNRPYPYGNIWSTDAVQAARLGLGDEAIKGMKLLIRTYQTCPNGLTDDANGRFEYLGTHLSAINESLLQSYDDKIRVFPALPGDRGFVGRFTLMAKGGFLVSSEVEDREIKYVTIRSLFGHSVTMENPWGSERIRIRQALDDATLLSTADREFTLPTVAKAVYIIERVDKPLNRFTHERLTGTANKDAKRLTGSSATLGSSP